MTAKTLDDSGRLLRVALNELRCPSCGAPQKGLVPGVPARCVFCKREFTLDPPVESNRNPAATVRQAGATTPGAKPTVLGLIVLVVLLMGVGAALSIAGRSAPSPDTASGGMPPVELSSPIPPTTVVAAAPPTPTAELTQVVEATTSIGGKFFLAEYSNTGTIRIDRPSVIVSGFDANGARVVEQAGYAVRARLEPGESIVVLALIAAPPAGATRYEVRAKPPESSGYSTPEVAVEIVESREQTSFGSTRKLVGTVRNNTATDVRFTRIVSVGRDADGRPCSFADGIPSETSLAAGASTGFDLSVGTFQASPPVRWEITAFGRPN